MRRLAAGTGERTERRAVRRHSNRHASIKGRVRPAARLNRVPAPNINQDEVRIFSSLVCAVVGGSIRHDDTLAERRIVVASEMVRAVERREKTGESKRRVQREK